MAKHPRPGSRRLPQGLVILHEDQDVIVVDKPPGLLSVGADADRPRQTRTAHFVLTDYVRKSCAARGSGSLSFTAWTARPRAC